MNDNMMYDRFQKMRFLIKLAEEVGEENSAWFLSTIQRLGAIWNDVIYQKTVYALNNNNFTPMLDKTFPVPFKQGDLEAVDGPYKVGRLSGSNIDFGFTKLHINRHGLIIGDSGTGKSTLIKVLASQLIQDNGVRLLIIDPKEGGDYRFLAKLTDNIVILRPKQLKLNPFTHIPNVPLSALREAVIEVTAGTYKVFDASEGIIAKHVDIVFSEYEQPTFYDFARSLRSEKTRYSGRRQGYLDSLETRLVKTLISLGDILDCRADYFAQLADCHVVIETGELSGSMQTAIVNWLMMKELHYSIKNMDRRKLRVYCFDESQGNIFPRYQAQARTPYMATLVTQARAFNVGLLALAQNPSLILQELIGNSCIKSLSENLIFCYNVCC